MLPRRLRFSEAYAEGYSAIDSAILAGCEPASAQANAHRLLKDPEVIEAINLLLDKRQKPLDENLDALMASLHDILLDEHATVAQCLRAAHLMVQTLKHIHRPRPRLPRQKQAQQSSPESAIETACLAVVAQARKTFPETQEQKPPLVGAANQLRAQTLGPAAHADTANLTAYGNTENPIPATPKPKFAGSLRKAFTQQNREKTQQKTIKNHHFRSAQSLAA